MPGMYEALADDLMTARDALNRLLHAVRRLGSIKDGKTLFEGSPTKDPECGVAWIELNNAMKNAQDVVDALNAVTPNAQ